MMLFQSDVAGENKNVRTEPKSQSTNKIMNVVDTKTTGFGVSKFDPMAVLEVSSRKSRVRVACVQVITVDCRRVTNLSTLTKCKLSTT